MAQYRSTLEACESKKRTVRIMNMYNAGLKLKEIAKVEKISFQAVHKRIEKELKKIESTGHYAAEKVKARQNMRLDEAINAIWYKIKNGDLDAVNALVRLEKRIADLNGTDAPKKFANAEGDDLFSTFIDTVKELHEPENK